MAKPSITTFIPTMCNQDYYRYIAELKGGDEAVATAAKANQEALNSVQVGPRDATVLDAP